MTVKTKETEGRSRWTEDMWEDYQNADADERRYLISRWGEPKR